MRDIFSVRILHDRQNHGIIRKYVKKLKILSQNESLFKLLS